MPNIKYIARVLTGVRWKKLSHMLDVVHDKCGQSRVHTFFDILWCAARYGAGYYDYVMYGFYDLNGKQRDTYLTRVRNRKVFELMNDPAYNDDFDDKLRFNETFRAYLHRKTLNGETATEQQMADFESPAAMLAYVREKKMVVLEHQLIQHPDMARLHPGSVNTMRILTDNVNGHVTIAYIIVKMGTGDSVCDNSGQGGILARVDVDTGRITTPATDDYFHLYDRHPDTGIPLVGYQLPMVPEAIALAKEAAQVFPRMGHVGWDMAITPDGPAIIEGNNFPGTDLCQLAPLWPEKTGLWPYYKKILNLK